MEDIHGVDVSWLHHSTRDHHHHHHRDRAPTSPGLTRDSPPKTSSHGGLPHHANAHDERTTPSAAPAVQEVSLPPPPPLAQPPTPKQPPQRPSLLNRGTGDKPTSPTANSPKSPSRRNSWMSSISSKFSSQTSPTQPVPAQAQNSPVTANGVHGTTSSANGALNGIQQANGATQPGHEPYVPQPPKGSFISNALRRLSSGTQVGTIGKVCANGGVCPRRVLNVDRNRPRCLVPELDQNRLRRVAFCVDVEIAGGPRYKDDADSEERKKKRKDKKLKEKGEGEVLKHPEQFAQEKEQQGTVTVNDGQDKDVVGIDGSSNPEGSPAEDEDKKEHSKKKEKKKRSEAERKERKEKKRRKAEENGSVPLELTRDDDSGSADNTNTNTNMDTPITLPAAPRPQDRPTTDPLRIYRRCCQLRETPILKRISDQLQNPKTCSVVTSGVVTCLDLTGSRLQLADYVTLSDWLAVVPVKKLLLEDADLTDEKTRVILAGLLAAKVPETSRRRRSADRTVTNDDEKVEERAGVILKLVLKNNPKIGAEGWRHIALFIYMCKSIQAIDCSLIPFPKPRLQPTHQAPNASQASSTPIQNRQKETEDILSKAISERLGGSRLEEFALAECGLTAPIIRKIIDGMVVSGVQRLSLAGNDINDEGFDHILHYIKSGVCQGIDLGGTDMRTRMPKLADALTKDSRLWALGLADCDLTPKCLSRLFPAIVNVPDLKFLDLSRNRDLFSHQSTLWLLRKYVTQLKGLKRLHLMDVALTPEQTIGLAEVLPDCPQLAHIGILDNPLITAVATATDEATQEEAAAMYASLMVAAKVSHTIVCVDVDVPGPESSEVVKALAKQVVAYCLRNMENYSDIPELRKPAPKDVEMPDVLVNLVEDAKGDASTETTAADNDYIVGGTGILKALNYCLLQKATDLRRQSVQPSGASTPWSLMEISEESTKARTMSKNLLDSARTIRSRLQAALVREARAHNEMAYRRLLYLDQTLQGMIQRFEDEYPETRLIATDNNSIHSSVPSTSPPTSSVPTINTANTTSDVFFSGNESEEDEPKAHGSRHNSDVSLASRALSLEEGRLHRLGHRVRTEIINASRPSSSHSEQANLSGTLDETGLPDHLVALREKFLTYSGEEIRQMTESLGWEKAFDHVADNAEQLKQLKEEEPEEFEKFRMAQIAALKNRNPGIHGPDEKPPKESKPSVNGVNGNGAGSMHGSAIED